ncbi:septal ring lytic transglycosylase RlpA family protein [Belnapia mucosa]|nr:septal ring lytic transglycosylase RlpA family protein [Belnapia mucosa]
MTRTLLAAMVAVSTLAMAGPTRAEEPALRAEPRPGAAANAGDHSGRVQQGRASYYGQQFNGRRMANGRPFRLDAPVAASKTLPLGTTARVTNRENGRSATVRVEDRGPYVPGRNLDVSPRVADQLGMRRDGVAPVEIAPVEVPQPDGSIRPGAAAGGRSQARR